MSKWKYVFTDDCKRDLKKLSGNQKQIVIKAIDKIAANPLPFTEGGYGKPLGNKNGINLSGLYEVKLRGQNLRVIYKLEKDRMLMVNIAVSKRADFEVYKIAVSRIHK